MTPERWQHIQELYHTARARAESERPGFGLAIHQDRAIRQASLDLNLDLYNALNADTILTQNNAYGATWLRPTSIIPSRFVKLSARFDF
jgi:hypothetical protein